MASGGAEEDDEGISADIDDMHMHGQSINYCHIQYVTFECVLMGITF